ncbi:MAG: hypothetical protein V4642_10460, partial [Bacteroidota bacterium]
RDHHERSRNRPHAPDEGNGLYHGTGRSRHGARRNPVHHRFLKRFLKENFGFGRTSFRHQQRSPLPSRVPVLKEKKIHKKYHEHF